MSVKCGSLLVVSSFDMWESLYHVAIVGGGYEQAGVAVALFEPHEPHWERYIAR